MTEQIESASWALAMADSLGRIGTPLLPAMAGCPHCRTMRMIASPALGPCLGCGGDLEVLVSSRVTATAFPVPASAA